MSSMGKELEPIKSSGRYMAGIDGLRALAVLAVIVYHLNYNWAPGGLLGVGIFFVLSGYLITDLLIAQWSRDGRLDMKDFWLRRARRLLPALLILLVIVAVWVTLFQPEQLSNIRGDVPAAVLYVSNWWLIFHDVSYFEKFGPPSPLGHLWSLAVEEQFYLFWPLLLTIGLRFIKRRGPFLLLTLFAAFVSALAMAILYEPGLDPSRVYYGTDTRVFALLIGAALAYIWPSRKLSPNLSRSAKASLDAVGGIGLLILLVCIWKTDQYDDFLYRGGLLVLSVVSAVVVATLAHPASSLAKVMGCKPLRWLGVRSYGIYLWHFPIIVLTTPAVEQNESFAVLRAVIQFAACIILAALSWKYIEEPIRHGAMGRLWSKLRARKEGQVQNRYNRWIASGCAVLLCATYFGVASLTSDATANHVPPSSHKAPDHSEATHEQTQEPPVVMGPVKPNTPVISNGHTNGNNQAKPKEPAKQNETANAKGSKSSNQTGSSNTPANPSRVVKPPLGKPSNPEEPDPASTPAEEQPDPTKKPGALPVKSGQGITVLGDSVMLDVAPHLEKLLPGIVIDAKVGRQMKQAPEVIKQLKARGHLGNRVIIELGTNGSFSKEQLLALLKSLEGSEQIILVNTRVPRPWENAVNTTLSEVAAIVPNTKIVDWHSASAGKSTYFYKDGVHLNPEGSKVYASLLSNAVSLPTTEPTDGAVAANHK